MRKDQQRNSGFEIEGLCYLDDHHKIPGQKKKEMLTVLYNFAGKPLLTLAPQRASVDSLCSRSEFPPPSKVLSDKNLSPTTPVPAPALPSPASSTPFHTHTDAHKAPPVPPPSALSSLKCRTTSTSTSSAWPPHPFPLYTHRTARADSAPSGAVFPAPRRRGSICSRGVWGSGGRSGWCGCRSVFLGGNGTLFSVRRVIGSLIG